MAHVASRSQAGQKRPVTLVASCCAVFCEITPLGSPSATEHTLAGIQIPLCPLCLNRVAESKHSHRHYISGRNNQSIHVFAHRHSRSFCPSRSNEPMGRPLVVKL